MRSGALVVTSAVYRTLCPCERRLEIQRGEECPPCPGCEREVDWAYQHGTYRPTEAASGLPPLPDRLWAF